MKYASRRVVEPGTTMNSSIWMPNYLLPKFFNISTAKLRLRNKVRKVYITPTTMKYHTDQITYETTFDFDQIKTY